MDARHRNNIRWEKVAVKAFNNVPPNECVCCGYEKCIAMFEKFHTFYPRLLLSVCVFLRSIQLGSILFGIAVDHLFMIQWTMNSFSGPSFGHKSCKLSV